MARSHPESGKDRRAEEPRRSSILTENQKDLIDEGAFKDAWNDDPHATYELLLEDHIAAIQEAKDQIMQEVEEWASQLRDQGQQLADKEAETAKKATKITELEEALKNTPDPVPSHVTDELMDALHAKNKLIEKRSEDLAAKEAEIALVKYRDAYAALALQMTDQSGRATTLASYSYNKRSFKLPDPDVLTNGKTPKFESWLKQMKNKLSSNADYFPTARIRIAYVQSRLGWKAAEDVLTKSNSVTNSYKDADDMLEHLKTIFEDVNRVIIAKNELLKYYMKFNDRL